MGVNWHEDHFICGGCKTKLIGTQFMDVNGAPFCQKCYLSKHADRCKGCSKPIADKAVIALDAKWHQMCFRCSVSFCVLVMTVLSFCFLTRPSFTIVTNRQL